MYVLKQTYKNKEKVFRYIEFKKRYEFDMIIYYISYINKFKVFGNMFKKVTKNYDVLMEEINNEINNLEKISDAFLDYINSVKKFEERSIRAFKEMFDEKPIKEVLFKAHNNRGYNLIYNMRNYDEHISTPLTAIDSNIDGNIKLYADIKRIRGALRSTGWKGMLDKQFIDESVIEVNSYILESYDMAMYIYKEIYKYIIGEDAFLYKFCVRVHEFYNKYRDDNNVFLLYLCEKADYTKLDFHNNIDILFIKEILLSKVLHITNMPFRAGQIITDDNIEYKCISKKFDILNNRIIDQCFVAACLDSGDINFILNSDRG